VTLLMSVHLVVDAPIRLYANHEAALADQENWKQSDAASEFLGFRLVRFEDGVPVEESNLIDACENAVFA
jgi:hypothetical protein